MIRRLPFRLRARATLGVRLGWGIADQGVSSLTNFLIGVVAARNFPPSEFGSFAVVFAIYTLMLSVSRTIASDPLIIRFSASSREAWRGGTASATGTAVSTGVFAGAFCILVGQLIGAPLGSGLVALGVMLPGLLLQDAWRYAFFSEARGSKAFVNDLVWGLLLAVWMAILTKHADFSVDRLVFAWGFTGSVAGGLGLLQGGVVPKPTHAVRWMRQHRDLITLYLGEFAVTMAANQLMVFSVGALGGLQEAGALRGGQLLFGPLNILFLGASLVAVPEAAKLLSVSKANLRVFCFAYAACFALTGLTLGIVAWTLPTNIGIAILGENWVPAHRLVIAMTIGSVAAAVYMAASIGLKAMAAAHLSFRSRLIMAPLSLATATIGAAYLGAYGAAWGMAIALIIGSLIWWRNFAKALREHGAVPIAIGTQTTTSVRAFSRPHASGAGSDKTS